MTHVASSVLNASTAEAFVAACDACDAFDGTALRALRLGSGMTLEAFAQRVNARCATKATRVTVSQWEGGSKPIPRRVVERLVLDPPLAALVADAADERPVGDLERLRTRLGLSRPGMAAWFGERLGRRVSAEAVKAWERGRNGVPQDVRGLVVRHGADAAG